MAAANVTFYKRVKEALQDAQLHTALNTATTRFTAARGKVLAELPEVDALRDHGRRIRAHTIAHLDQYLAQFAAAVEQQGGHVYWAETVEEATRYVVELAQARGVKPEAIVLEEAARTTLENATFTARLLAERKWKSAIIVSDRGHLMYALPLFRDAFEAQGIALYWAPTDYTRLIPEEAWDWLPR